VQNRRRRKEVRRLAPEGFQRQADPGLDAADVRNIAGLLCVTGGTEPLDSTPVHPEDYPIARAVADKRGVQPIELLGQNLRDVPVDEFVSDGTPRQRVIGVLQLLHHGKEDPRGHLVATANEGVRTLADLHTDRELHGRVANLTEFGAFVDLGIGQDGLVHISQIPGSRLRDPAQMLRVGEVITVWVLNIDQAKSKIGLTMFKPRHLQEGRLPTLGERMDQQQGRGRRRRPAGEPAQAGGRFRGEGGPPRRRGPDDPRDRGDRRGPGRDRERFGGDRDRGERRPRGPREQRIYTVEPAREVAETRTHKGEVTSLASLRALLGNPQPAAPPTAPEQPEGSEQK
jgi:uncharacterized protein